MTDPLDTVWLVNGKPTGLDPSDRGLAYGDGLFETMAATDGRVRWLEYHLERCAEGCQRLGIDSVDFSVVRDEILSRCPRMGRHVVKLIVTRGPGSRGYRFSGQANPTRILGIVSWPDYPQSNYTQGIRLATCTLRLARNRQLAGIKHLCRLEQVLAYRELAGRDADEGLLLDTEGLVISGCSSNLFAVERGRLVTPALTNCGVMGVMRRVVLEMASRLGLEALEAEFGPERLESADELFVTNALFGVWPVRECDRRRYPVGVVARQLITETGCDRGA